MSDKKFSYLLPLAFALVLAFGILLGTKISPVVNYKPAIYDKDASYNRIKDILNYIDQRYVDTVNTDSIVDALVMDYLNKPETIDELFKSLDPHSSYIHKEDLQKFNEDLDGNFDGIGIEFNIIDDTILVVSALSGGPSEKLGIMSGDKIIYINDSLSAGNHISTEKVMLKLRGKKGTPVDLKIYRNGENKLLDFNIVRDAIPVTSIDASYMADAETGYIKINKFARETPNEFALALSKLQSQGMKKLILDLRGNPGGFLSGAVDIADQFLSGDKLIVYTNGRSVGRQDYRAHDMGMFETGDLVVMINEGSASASEILTGALKDNNRATIVGRRSFGKGLVQEVYDLPDSSAVRLTIARYYTPDGRCIQRPYNQGVEAYYNEYIAILENGGELPDSLKNNDNVDWGIHPDVYVKQDTSAMQKVYNQIMNRGYLQQFSYAYYSTHVAKFSSFNTVQQFDGAYTIDASMFSQFEQYINSRDKDFTVTNEQYATLHDKLCMAIKAFIARSKWGNDGFYPLINKIDPDFNAAFKTISDGVKK